MNVGTLFSGIDGFAEAGARLGWKIIFQVEIDPFCQKILKQTYAESEKHEDIREFNGTKFKGVIDILCGGWPCQDNSRAKQTGGPGKGLHGTRSGLFYEYERIVRAIQPRYAISENVPDVLTINGGRDFNYILSAMAEMGYDVTWGVLRASDIGAPHHRERLYMVAYPRGQRFQTLHTIWKNARAKVERKKISGLFNGTSISVGNTWQSEPPILRMDDGVPDRPHRIKACGNSVVPEIPFQIFKAIEQINNHL